MPKHPFFTVDVFTTTRFGGNPLAVVLGGENLSQDTLQAIAAEFNLSETTFVLPPADPAHTARVRIFNRTEEMAFAGHPMVGTAFVLAQQDPTLHTASFEVPAGTVHIRITRGEDGQVVSTSIDTPQALTTGATIDPATIARALQIEPSDVLTHTHPPIIALNGNPFVIVELTKEALSRCAPDLQAFRAARSAYPHIGERFPIHVYCRDGDTLDARMFSPLSGTWEDPATGSANAPLACLLLSLEPHRQAATFTITQGVAMGRPSLLLVDTRRTEFGITATIHGSCVPVMQGEIVPLD